MKREAVLDAILDQRTIGIVRSKNVESACETVDLLVGAGVMAVEVSLVTPGALEAISASRERHDGVAAIGVGTVLTLEDAVAAEAAGAQFVVAPVCADDVIRYCAARGLVVVPGAGTASEMVRAQAAGAPLVKVFPASNWTPRSISHLLSALPSLRLVPTGGVGLADAPDWIRAGAVAVGVGSALSDAAHTPEVVKAFLASLHDG